MQLSNLFKGRLNRRNFALGLLTVWAFMLLSLFVLGLLGFGSDSNPLSPVLTLVWVIEMIAVFLFNISLAIRRWHDLGKSGFYILLQLIPLVNALTLLFLLFAGGEKVDNKYGKVPDQEIHWPDDILAKN